LEMGAEFVRG